MSDKALLYIVITLAVIVIVAILRARSGVKVKLPGGVEASVDAPAEKRAVTVAENVKFENAEVGNVTGQSGGVPAAETRVMNGAEIKGSKTGDITGVVIGNPAPEKKG